MHKIGAELFVLVLRSTVYALRYQLELVVEPCIYTADGFGDEVVLDKIVAFRFGQLEMEPLLELYTCVFPGVKTRLHAILLHHFTH